MGERSGRGHAGGVGDAGQRGEHAAGEEPPAQRDRRPAGTPARRLRSERTSRRRSDRTGKTPWGRGSALTEDRAIGDVAQQEHPHGREQQGAREHEEAGVAEGELEANAQPGGSSHGLLPRARCPVRVDAVPDAGHGGDDPGLAEALAQCRDRDAHGVGERVGVLVPRPLQQLLGADDTALGSDEHLEHRELLPGQRDVAAVAVDLAAERVEPQTRDLPHGRPVVRAPAVERSRRSTSSWSSNGFVR